jgi:hypothetical protein
MQAAHDDSVVRLVQQCKGKALVTARVGKWIEPDESLSREEVARRALHDSHPGSKFVQLAPDLMDRVKMLPEYGFEIAAIDATGQLPYPPLQFADLQRLDYEHRHETKARQHECDGSQVARK